jgi:DNA invertase Pin-like site-specific DNA recombinase
MQSVTDERETAAAYFRCSKDRNDQASVEEQEESGVARCETEGWELRRYEDNDRSASRYARKDRGDWIRLLGDLRAGLFTVVWLWESSRGDRKAYEWLGFLEDCRERGVRIYVETHGRLYDIAGNHRDWKTLADDGVNNAYASDETSLRIKRHLASAARKGRPHGAAGYGIRRVYDQVTGKYLTQEPDPGTAPVAAEIITRLAAGEPVMAIRDDLQARGIPGAGGGPWDRKTIRQIGLSPAYAGLRKAGAELIEAWTPVVPLEVHRAAVAVLRAREGQRSSRQKHLLSYLAACECGAALSGYANRYGTPMYKCRAHGCVNIGMEWLDELVTLAVLGALAAPDAAAAFRSDTEAAARRRNEASALRAQLDEWARAAVSPRAYAVKEAQILPQIDRAERAAAAAESPPVLRGLLTAEDVRAGWDHLNIPSRRDIIRALMTVSVSKAENQARASRTDPGRVVVEWRQS